jgi:hypothetical protein
MATAVGMAGLVDTHAMCRVNVNPWHMANPAITPQTDPSSRAPTISTSTRGRVVREEQLIEAEEEQAAELEAAAEAGEASQDATAATSHEAATAGDRTARPDA